MNSGKLPSLCVELGNPLPIVLKGHLGKRRCVSIHDYTLCRVTLEIHHPMVVYRLFMSTAYFIDCLSVEHRNASTHKYTLYYFVYACTYCIAITHCIFT